MADEGTEHVVELSVAAAPSAPEATDGEGNVELTAQNMNTLQEDFPVAW